MEESGRKEERIKIERFKDTKIERNEMRGLSFFNNSIILSLVSARDFVNM